jgi:hypothetical protein
VFEYVTPLPASGNFQPTEPLTILLMGFVFLGFSRFLRERFANNIDKKPSA